jgi:hypothetical protein
VNETLTVPINRLTSITVTLYEIDANGQSVLLTSYTSPDWSPRAQVWTGDDRAPWSPGPTAAWATDGSNGQVIVTFPASVTAAVEPGTYAAQVDLVPAGGGDALEAWAGQILVVATPGTAAVLPTYGTLRAMRDYASWIENLESKGDEGWLRARWRAHQKINRILAARYRSWYDRQRIAEGWLGGVPTPGIFEGYLEVQGGLRVTDRVSEIAARYAIALACEQQIDGSGKNPFAELGQAMQRQADLIWAGLQAEVSSNPAAVPIVYDLRVTPDAVIAEPWPAWMTAPQ